MTRHVFSFAAAFGLTAFSIVTAFAHSTLERPEAPAGGYKAVVRIPHGCDGQATNAVKIVIPEGFIDAKPMPKAGWQVATEKGDYAKTYKLHGKDVAAGLKSVTWSGGDLPDDFYDEFVVNGRLDGEPGTRLAFIVTQTCASGSVAWDEIAAEGQDPHSLEHPAPTVTIQGSGSGGGGTAGNTPGPQYAEAKAGPLTVWAGWVKAMLPAQKAGGGYLTVTNEGKEADRLIGVSTPAAGKLEIHEMKVENNIMTMRPVEGGIEIPAGATVELKPGGFHLMFMQVGQPFAEGSTVPVTLQFEKAGKVELAFPVLKDAGSASGEHQH